MTEPISERRIRELISQADTLDQDTFHSAITVLSQDIDRELRSRRAPGAPTFSQLYDAVTNEERTIADARAPTFEPVGDAAVPTGIAEDIADGTRELEDLVEAVAGTRGATDAIERGAVSDRIAETGEKLLRRFAAACRSEICEDRADLFELNRETLVVTLTPVITGVLAGALTLAMFAPLAVLVAVFIVDVGLDVFCESEHPGENTTHA